MNGLLISEWRFLIGRQRFKQSSIINDQQVWKNG